MTRDYDDDWFHLVHADLSQFQVQEIDLSSLVHESRLGIDELAFGYRLGVLDAQVAVDISLRRANMEIPQSEEQEIIAFSLPDQLPDVIATLRGRDLSGVPVDVEAMWLYCAMNLFVRRWRLSAAADIRLEVWQILAHWTLAATRPWAEQAERFLRGWKRSSGLVTSLQLECERVSLKYLEPAL